MPKRTAVQEVKFNGTPSPEPTSLPTTPYKPPPPPPQKKARIDPFRPILEPRDPGCEYPTPTKAKVQAVFEYLPHIGIQPNAEHIFDVFEMKKTQGYEAVQAESCRHLNNRLGFEENPRHRPRSISPQKKREIKKLLENEGFDAETMT